MSDIDPRSCTNIDVLGRPLPELAAHPQQHLFPQNRQSTVSATQLGPSDYQGYHSVLAACNNRGGGRRSSDNAFSVKIIQARMTGSSARPDFRRTGQAYVVMTEGMRIAESRVRTALHDVNPHYRQAREERTERQLKIQNHIGPATLETKST